MACLRNYAGDGQDSPREGTDDNPTKDDLMYIKASEGKQVECMILFNKGADIDMAVMGASDGLKTANTKAKKKRLQRIMQWAIAHGGQCLPAIREPPPPGTFRHYLL